MEPVAKRGWAHKTFIIAFVCNLSKLLLAVGCAICQISNSIIPPPPFQTELIPQINPTKQAKGCNQGEDILVIMAGMQQYKIST